MESEIRFFSHSQKVILDLGSIKVGLVRLEGLEPPPLSGLASKASVSAISPQARHRYIYA